MHQSQKAKGEAEHFLPLSHTFISVFSAQGDGLLKTYSKCIWFFLHLSREGKTIVTAAWGAEGIFKTSPTQSVGKSHYLRLTRFCSPMAHRSCGVRAANISSDCVTALTYTDITLLYLFICLI